MTKVVVLDDWQGVARSSTDWSPLLARAEVVFFAHAFDDVAFAVMLFAVLASHPGETPRAMP